nr:cache domain-containing protein [uncultured Holophaga sp.]
MKPFTKWSVRTHLLAFVAAVILPFLGLIIHAQMKERAELLETARQRLLIAAELASLRESSLIGEVRQTLSTLAQLPGFGQADSRGQLPILSQVLKQNPHLDNIFLTDPQGHLLGYGGASAPREIAQRAYFQHVTASKQPHVGSFTVAADTGRLVLPIASPVLAPDGSLRGVLVSGIPLARLGRALPRDLGITGAVLDILDHRGHLLYSTAGLPDLAHSSETPAYMASLPPGSQATIQQDLRGDAPTLRGIRHLDLNPGREDGAWLRVSLPEKPLVRRAWATFYRNLAILGALGLALIALAWWLGAFLIALPISRLVTVAQRMSEGNFSVRTGLAGGANEVGRLAQAFESLGTRLATRERQLRLALARSEQISDRFRSLEENSPDGVFWIDVEPSGHYRFAAINPAFERILGHTQSEICGRRFEEALPSETAQAAIHHVEACIRCGSAKKVQDWLETPAGTRRLDYQIIPLPAPGGEVQCLVGFCRDITEAHLAEEALRQSQKLNSLGVLAGGIAHDFNNLLTAILGNLNLAQIKLGTTTPAAGFLENIERTVLRASDLTRQLLAYSGRGHFVVKPLDLSRAVMEMTHLLEVSISKKIHLEYRFAENLPPVEADAAQIQQVIMNLVTNANEAIGDRSGLISISTRCVEINESFISLTFPDQLIDPGLFVVLEVSDSGCGMSRKVMERIFDPFFTTKSQGKGLGLSAMLGILRGHRAGIRIYSELDRGSVFKLFFPAARGAVLPPDYVSPALPIRAEGTILVVDDEPDIRENACIALESLGFTVLTAADGLEAVEVYREYRDEIRAVLMDLTMPRLDGKEALQRIRTLDPKACIILSSGYSEQDIRHTFGDGMPSGFIQKPYQIKDLQHAIVDGIRLSAKALPPA